MESRDQEKYQHTVDPVSFAEKTRQNCCHQSTDRKLSGQSDRARVRLHASRRQNRFARNPFVRLQPDFIHEFVAGKSSRTLLLLHGTGGNERDLISLGHELDPEASLLSPRGKILENGMPRFFRRLAEGVFDLEDLQKRTHELAISWFRPRSTIRSTVRTSAVGYSNGANIAASMLLLRPEILSAAILFRAMVPLVPETKPDLKSKRIWIGAAFMTRSFPHQTRKSLPNCCVPPAQMSRFAFFKAGTNLRVRMSILRASA